MNSPKNIILSAETLNDDQESFLEILLSDEPFLSASGTLEWSMEWAEALECTMRPQIMLEAEGEVTEAVLLALQVGRRIFEHAEKLKVWEPQELTADEYSKEYFKIGRWDIDVFVTIQKRRLLEGVPKPFIGKVFPLAAVMPINELFGAEIDAREWLVDGFLQASSMVMLFGFRGRGKSWFALFLCIAIASGGRFLKWQAPKKRRVLFVDGEMVAVELRDRLFSICGNEPPALLEVISSEVFRRNVSTGLKIDDPDQQMKFKLLLNELRRARRNPEVIVFDNLSSMTNADENGNTEQGPLMDFMRDLRHMGYSIIYLHHTGKNNEQRGASKREDFLDMSIRLGDPSTPATDGCKFKMSITKCRGKMPSPSEIECAVVSGMDGRLDLVYDTPENKEPPKWVQCLRYIQEHKPANQKAISEALHIEPSNLSPLLKKAREKGLLVELVLTLEGINHLDKVYNKSAGEESY